MDDGEGGEGGEGVSHTRITGDSVSLSSSGSCLGSIMSRCPGRRFIILSNLILPSLPSIISIQFMSLKHPDSVHRRQAISLIKQILEIRLLIGQQGHRSPSLSVGKTQLNGSLYLRSLTSVSPAAREIPRADGDWAT